MICNFDYSKLNGRITEICGTQAEFAKRIHMSEHTVSKKLTGKVLFKQDEIKSAVQALGLEEKDVWEYFFTERVQRL